MSMLDSCLIGVVPVLDHAIRQAFKKCEGRPPRYIVLHPEVLVQLRLAGPQNLWLRANAAQGSDFSVTHDYAGIPIMEKVSAEYPFLRDADDGREYI